MAVGGPGPLALRNLMSIFYKHKNLPQTNMLHYNVCLHTVQYASKEVHTHLCRLTGRRKATDVHTGGQAQCGVEQVSAADLP